MKKEYIRDNEKVRLCSSNIAKMNILEGMYYMRLRLIENIIQAINDCVEHYYVIVNALAIFIVPIWYPIVVIYEIHKAKKEVKNNAYTKVCTQKETQSL